MSRRVQRTERLAFADYSTVSEEKLLELEDDAIRRKKMIAFSKGKKGLKKHSRSKSSEKNDADPVDN